ncbi:MAG TPA: hypothetical protein VF181_02535 [Balneolaceae bacterium]
MKHLLISISCCLTLFISNCSPKLSPYFESTRFLESAHMFIVNDSLTLSLKAPSDLRFIQNKEMVIDRVQKQNMNPEDLLAYGITEIPPHYQVFIWINSKHRVKPTKVYEMVRDTVLQGHKIVLACVTKKEKYFTNLIGDCTEIFASISTDTNYKNNVPSVLDLSRQFGNRYYQGLHAIRNYPVKGRSEKWLRLQMAINYASFLAPTPIYDKLLDKFPSPLLEDSLKKIIRTEAIQGMVNVKKTLLREAKNHRMVIFNENHFYPTHRKLITKLLPAFKQIEFTHLALEAAWPGQDSLLNAGHPPTIDTGFYTREPRFAELIRTAQKLGFTIVAYENTNPSKGRERGQANNLYNQTFAKKDSTRVLVLVGYDHILERPTPNGKNWMVYLLHKYYAINPLTISQTHLNNYRELAKPVALVPSNLFNDCELNSIDWLLLNNLSLTAHTPNYIYSNPFNETIQIALFLTSELGPLNDYSNRIPYKTGLVKPNETVEYHLPKADYCIVIYDQEGNILAEKNLSKEEANNFDVGNY